MTLSARLERRLLQMTIAIAGFVPVATGLMGAMLGAGMLGESGVSASLDSHIRYLSGLLLGIGLAFWEAIPTIEKRGARVRLLTAIVFLGGLIRLIGIIGVAMPGPSMIFGVVMETVVTPLICLWQMRVARRMGLG